MLPKYILITPARNEARFIERTLKSMVKQTFPPVRWVIVSDGSTDETDAIVQKYMPDHDWIDLIRTPERKERHFAGKVHAFNAGYASVAGLDHEVVGNLDADVSFGDTHFEYLLGKFAEDPKLGVGGAPFREGTYQYDYRYTNIENVWGGCQLFRRDCFRGIGGYKPIKGGCIDHIAVLTARMNGWKTRTFVDRVCHHHRVMGTAQQNCWNARFKMGAKDYSVGNHPVWEAFRAIYQMSNRPIVVGGLALASGYAWSFIRRTEVPISAELRKFVREEQMARLRQFFASRILKRPRTAEHLPSQPQ